ncbi:hypothetical protein UPYG_G00249810 [Umbra pygmaea]|uniref:UvrD-like helicase C-terminal domain-containing protein n=1 Tax=Umbra pygmaea TaxID=75934 RepID=A0ABD0W7B8_UMBPY
MGLKTTSFKQLDYDAILDLSGSYTIPSEDKRFILILLPNTNGNEDCDLSVAINDLLKAAPGLKDDTHSQFIAFRRKDCAMINELCCKHYSDHCTKNSKNRLEFQPGDKVCCTKNGYVTDQNKKYYSEGAGESDRTRVQERERENGATKRDETREKKKIKEQDKERLCNGEIFFIKNDVTEEENGSARRRKERYLTLDDHDGRTLCVSFREIQKECKLQHAWARTIHTFQGSETETVVYVLGNGSVQTWKHVYTAVTRGQKRVYVIARREGMESAIRRRIIPRNTRLGTLAKKLRSQSGPGTPLRPDPGFGSTQTTPQTSIPLRRLLSPDVPPKDASRAPSNCVQAQSNPVLPSMLLRNHPSTAPQADVTDTSLMEDISFSQAYSWSPMDTRSQELFWGQCEEQGVTTETSSTIHDGQMGGALAESSPFKRALSPDRVELVATPFKQHKTEAFDSPLGCSSLQQLSLGTRNRTSSKQLFQDPTT